MYSHLRLSRTQEWAYWNGSSEQYVKQHDPTNMNDDITINNTNTDSVCNDLPPLC